MNKYLAILIVMFVFQSVTGQDKISIKERDPLNVRIIEVNKNLVKYKMTDYEEGPVFSVKTNRISKIEYKNGYIDLMGYQNPRKNKPFGISEGLAVWLSEEGALFTTTVDYFVIPQIELEVNIGTDFVEGFFFSAGSRFHLNSNQSQKRFTPFTGFLLGTQYSVGYVQIPVGINYIARPGFNASLCLNEMIFFNSWQATFAELRIGWRF